MGRIHATALIDPNAELDSTVSVGPYTVIGAGVRIGAHTRIGSHCTLEGPATLGEHNSVAHHAALGGAPQDMKYRGEPTSLEIGHRNTLREFVTFNRGTAQGGGVTRLGDDNWVMAYVHLAHDAQVGDHCILANNATLAGHVQLGDWVILGGLTGVHQFCRVGSHAMTGFQSHVSQDVPPFMMVSGNPLQVHGFNVEGLRRRGFSRERIARVKQMHRLLYRDGLTLSAARSAVEQMTSEGVAPDDVAAAQADQQVMLDFLAIAGRGIVR
jgi:UDP-N-acetylglucosamine acyltransferase